MISLCCTHCKEEKPCEMFGKRKDLSRGYQYYCKDCANKLNKESKQAKPKGYYYQKAKEYQKNWKINHPDLYKNSMLKARYGITFDDYQEMLNSQNGVCKICNNRETIIDSRSGQVQMLSVDHNHTTGKIRGLLCQACNHAIGKLKENPDLCRKAAKYLETNNE